MFGVVLERLTKRFGKVLVVEHSDRAAAALALLGPGNALVTPSVYALAESA